MALYGAAAPMRRHRGRLPRRSLHRVDELAVGLHHLHPDRPRDPRRHQAPPERRVPPRLRRHPRRRRRHRGSRARRLRRGPRPRGRLGLHRHDPPADRRRRPPRPLLRHPEEHRRAAHAAQCLAGPAPRLGQPGDDAARRRLDPDVVLSQPVPPAGPGLRRLRVRCRPAPDDRAPHGLHDGHHGAAHDEGRRQAAHRRMVCWSSPPVWSGSPPSRPPAPSSSTSCRPRWSPPSACPSPTSRR